MTPSERKRFMAKMEDVRDDVVLVEDIIAEMDKILEWKNSYSPQSIERAYCAAHENALSCLVQRAGI